MLCCCCCYCDILGGLLASSSTQVLQTAMQGDPLLPMFFILVMDVLSHLVTLADEDKNNSILNMAMMGRFRRFINEKGVGWITTQLALAREILHQLKKNSTCGGLWRPPGFPFKKIFLHRSRKPLNPRPHPDAAVSVALWEPGQAITALWHMGTGEGIFLTSTWNSLLRRVELRTWGVPLGHLTVWARRPLADRLLMLDFFLVFFFNGESDSTGLTLKEKFYLNFMLEVEYNSFLSFE